MEQSNPEEVDSAVTTDANRVFEENPIIEVFDDPANLRILITLIDAGGQGLPPSNLAERANVDGMTIFSQGENPAVYGGRESDTC